MWMGAGHVLRTVSQIAYLVVLARVLGAEQFGAFLGVVAYVSILSPFSSMGSGHLLIKYVATDRSAFADHWGNAIGVTFLSAALLSLGATFLLLPYVLPEQVSIVLVIMVAVADLLFSRLVDVSARAFQGSNACSARRK